jgi:hypothetical protein
MTAKRVDVRIEHLVLTGIEGDPSVVVEELRTAFAARLAETIGSQGPIGRTDPATLSVVHVPSGPTAASIGVAVGRALCRVVR